MVVWGCKLNFCKVQVSQGELMTHEEGVWGPGKRRGGQDWPRANLASPSVWGQRLEVFCEAAGPSICQSGWAGVIEVPEGPYDNIEGLGAHSEAAQCLQRSSLCENAHVASRSRDQFGFREGVVVRAWQAKGGVTGGKAGT